MGLLVKLQSFKRELRIHGQTDTLFPFYSTSGSAAAKYESGKVSKDRFACSSLNEICRHWHSYFYTNVCWPNHTHNHKYGRVITFMVT